MISHFSRNVKSDTRRPLVLACLVAGVSATNAFGMNTGQALDKPAPQKRATHATFVTAPDSYALPEPLLSHKTGYTPPPLGKYLCFGNDADSRETYFEFITSAIEQAQKETESFFRAHFPKNAIDPNITHNLAESKGYFEALALAKKLENPPELVLKMKHLFREKYDTATQRLSAHLSEQFPQSKKDPNKRAQALLNQLLCPPDAPQPFLLAQLLTGQEPPVDKQ